MKKFILTSLLLSFFIWSCEGDEPAPEVEIGINRVDLRAQQTPVKDQGGRSSCIVFAATAAVEASYKRMGYGDLDLSEEFVNFMGKNLWLHPNWTDVYDFGEDGIENQMGAYSGGNGAGYIKLMHINGFKIPEEHLMPYHDSEAIFPSLSSHYFPFDQIGTKYQRDVNNFNLDTVFLKHNILHHDKFYGVGLARYHYETDLARNTDFLEGILRQGYEIVWDFSGYVLVSSPIWQLGTSGQTGVKDISGGHSMLLIGFDKTDADNPYFIVKNSWGDTFTNPTDPDNMTYISYDVVRNTGKTLAYIQLPINSSPYKEIQPLGIYDLSLDGYHARLDFYHYPGFWNSDHLPVPDRRFGSLYIGSQAYRVNGARDGNKLTFYFDDENPNAMWNHLGGRKFDYYYSSAGYMAGFHTDFEGGPKYGGYARKAGSWGTGVMTPRPFTPYSYLQSRWEVKVGTRTGTLILNNLGNPPDNPPTSYPIYGNFIDQAGNSHIAMASISVADSREMNLQLEMADGGFSAILLHLNHENGVMAGHTTTGSFGNNTPIVLIRTQ
jgi:hypothetical protein